MRRFDPWFNKQKPLVQKLIYFFPPFYFLSVIGGVAGSLVQQNNFKGGKRDFRLLDVIMFPWNVELDHPISLQKTLEKMVDENGVIYLNKDRPS